MTSNASPSSPEPLIRGLLQEAVEYHRRGRLQEAGAIYARVLQLDANHFGALHMLGVVLARQGLEQQALALLTHAAALRPGDGNVLHNRAQVLKDLWRLQEALSSYDRLVALKPQDAKAWSNRGEVLRLLERHEEALASFEKALAFDAADEEVLLRRGEVEFQLKNYAQALETSEQVLRRNPDHVQALIRRGAALANLARDAEALASFEQALRLDSKDKDAARSGEAAGDSRQEAGETRRHHVDALQMLAVEHHLQERLQEASAVYERVLQLDPSHIDALHMLGASLAMQGHLHRAMELLTRAAAMRPGDAAIQRNLGNLFVDLSRWREALACYDEALVLAPGDRETSFAKALVLLVLGDYARGWSLYESRWSQEKQSERLFSYPWARAGEAAGAACRWDGRAGSTPLLLWGEQGVGDQILFGSMLREAACLPGEKTVLLDRRLLPLFRRAVEGIRFVGIGDLDTSTWRGQHLPLGSLPEYFRPDAQSFAKATFPYLKADPGRVREIRARIARPGKVVCGVSWSSPAARNGMAKSMSLAEMVLPLSSLPMHWVDLQYGDTALERHRLEAQAGVQVQHLDDVDNREDLDGLAALIEACDCVLTVSNTTAHMAGALDKRTWVLRSRIAGFWYWRLGLNRGGWYPSTEVLAQDDDGGWTGALAEVRRQLEQMDM